jgi:hypothetical protein
MTTGSSVLQNGLVTPGHLASWTTDGVIQDSGVTFNNTYGVFSSTLQGINFNSTNTDFPIAINLPAGYTRYRIENILISGASASLSTATCGVFTQAAGAGTPVVTSASAITVTQSANDTNNNMQSLTISDQNTMSLIDTTLFFRVQGAQGSPATGTVTVFYQPIP